MWLVSIVLLLATARGLERKMSYSKNPGCESFEISLYYVRAEGPNDTLHYLWDFTNKPTVFLALTDPKDNLTVNCVEFALSQSNAFNFTQTPKYVFFLLLNKVIEFNDVNDTGILTPSSPRISYDTRGFSWTMLDEFKGDSDGKFVSLSMTASDYSGSQDFVSGNITIHLSAFGFENHDSELPRLLHSPNSTQCKISFDNIITNSGYNESRFAIEMILVSDDSRNSSSKISTWKNLDDENSPGVFSVVNVLTPKAQNQQFEGAFLEWRPVMYINKVPSISDSSEIVAYDLTNVSDVNSTLFQTLPYNYFGWSVYDFLLEQTVVSLGMTQDGFYKKTNYSSWTFLVNYGSPLEEKFSLLVILVMCIGLGLPALLVIGGGTFMFAKKIRRNKDELSLER